MTQIGASSRRFVPEWFDEFGSWLEYSESEDRAYCFCCFLFREKKDSGMKHLLKMVGMVFVDTLKQEYPLLQYEDTVPARLSLVA
jgi:hypothetical protein